MLSELSERIDHTRMELIKDRARIADLELLLGLDEEIQDPEDHIIRKKKRDSRNSDRKPALSRIFKEILSRIWKNVSMKNSNGTFQ
jgi:hypothetical protein